MFLAEQGRGEMDRIQGADHRGKGLAGPVQNEGIQVDHAQLSQDAVEPLHALGHLRIGHFAPAAEPLDDAQGLGAGDLAGVGLSPALPMGNGLGLLEQPAEQGGGFQIDDHRRFRSSLRSLTTSTFALMPRNFKFRKPLLSVASRTTSPSPFSVKGTTFATAWSRSKITKGRPRRTSLK